MQAEGQNNNPQNKQDVQKAPTASNWAWTQAGGDSNTQDEQDLKKTPKQGTEHECLGYRQ